MLNRFLGSNATDTEKVVDPTWIEHDGLHSKFNRDNNLKLKIMPTPLQIMTRHFPWELRTIYCLIIEGRPNS